VYAIDYFSLHNVLLFRLNTFLLLLFLTQEVGTLVTKVVNRFRTSEVIYYLSIVILGAILRW